MTYNYKLEPSEEGVIQFVLLVLIILGVSFLLFSSMWPNEIEDEVNEHSQYCEMVELWEQNKHINELHRPGWPPYQGKGFCDE